MSNFLDEFIRSFLPIFVAIDAIGVLPIILALSEDMEKKERSRMLRYAMVTALGLGLGFVAVGKLVLNALDISEFHFLVAGGLILLLLSARSLLTDDRKGNSESIDRETIGVFPIGVPLVVGPAVMTTLLVLIDRYSIAPVLIAFLVNLFLAWYMFKQSERIARLLGPGGLGAASKIAMLLLAAIAVRMMHRGILQLIESGDSLL